MLQLMYDALKLNLGNATCQKGHLAWPDKVSRWLELRAPCLLRTARRNPQDEIQEFGLSPTHVEVHGNFFTQELLCL